jgi:hypothetical protein
MSDWIVFKYPFNISSTIDVLMPPHAKVLYVDSQDGIPCIWALVDPQEQPKPRRFYMRATGQLVSSNLAWFATFQVAPFVWHVFEEKS